MLILFFFFALKLRMLIADTVKKVEALVLQKTVIESKKKGVQINYKMIEYMIISKRSSPTCKLQSGYTKIRQVYFNF